MIPVQRLPELLPRTDHDFATRLPFAFFFGVSLIDRSAIGVKPGTTVIDSNLLKPMRYEKHTGFEFLRLVIVLEHEGVKVSMASDLELGLRSVAQLVLLYPRR